MILANYAMYTVNNTVHADVVMYICIYRTEEVLGKIAVSANIHGE